jgi:hypothetical protein
MMIANLPITASKGPQANGAVQFEGKKYTLADIKTKVTQKLQKDNIEYSLAMEAPDAKELWIFVPDTGNMKNYNAAKASILKLPGAKKTPDVNGYESNLVMVNNFKVSLWVDQKMELFGSQKPVTGGLTTFNA